MSKLGTLLRQHREAAGMPVEHVASALGVHPCTVRRYESGKLKVGTDMLRAMMDAIGVTDPGLRAELRMCMELG